MGRFSERYLDQAIPIDMAWTPETEADTQRERLVSMGVMAMHIAQFPRRLGGEASSAELRADKRLARQMLNRFHTVLRSWGGNNADIEEAYLTAANAEADERLTKAAQLDWTSWWADYKPMHQATARRVATHALRLTDRKTANKLVHKLELEWQLIDDLLGLYERIGDTEPAGFEEARA